MGNSDLAPKPATLAELDHTWMTEAACAHEPDLLWTAEATDVTKDDRALMTRVCEACPVLHACRSYARSSYASAGFWAGWQRGKPHAPAATATGLPHGDRAESA